VESIEEKIPSQNNIFTKLSPIKIRCPVCKAEKKLKFPKTVINQAKQLTTISIPKGLICEHHFQTFVDKNFIVRGYQKVDFEYANNLLASKKSANKDKEFTEYIIIEENYLAYKPEKNKIIIERKNNHENLINKKKDDSIKVLNKPMSSENKEHLMNLEEIYNEFWDFIDDDNTKFQEFIEKDTRRDIIIKSS